MNTQLHTEGASGRAAETLSFIQLRSPAKINVFLEVHEKTR